MHFNLLLDNAGSGLLLVARRAAMVDKRGDQRNRRRDVQFMERRDERELREELVGLRAKHRLLDDQIVALEENPLADQLLVKRLKKKKLSLKDRMTSIEDQLLPDIIA